MEEVNPSPEALAEEASRQFLENLDALDELSRKVSREGLRRVFMIVTRFPYTGDITVKSVEEEKLLTQALYIKGLADQVTQNSTAADDAQKQVVETVAENIINSTQKE